MKTEMKCADLDTPADYARKWPKAKTEPSLHSFHYAASNHQSRLRDDVIPGWCTYGWAEYLYMVVVRESTRGEG
jgi:hypothetical protein